MCGGDDDGAGDGDGGGGLLLFLLLLLLVLLFRLHEEHANLRFRRLFQIKGSSTSAVFAIKCRLLIWTFRCGEYKNKYPMSPGAPSEISEIVSRTPHAHNSAPPPPLI